MRLSPGLKVSDLNNPLIKETIAKSFRDVAEKYQGGAPDKLSPYGAYDKSSQSWFWSIPMHEGDRIVMKPFIYFKDEKGQDVVITPSRNGKFGPIINVLYDKDGLIYLNTKDNYYKQNNTQKGGTNGKGI